MSRNRIVSGGIFVEKDDVNKIIEIFETEYPEPVTALNYSNAFELLIAVIMSAQTTDKQVNKVTYDLFKKNSTPEEILELGKEKLAEKIKSIGLYRNKSKYIIDTCKILIDKYDGKVPEELNELIKLSGVGRKTANVVLTEYFNKDTFPVDTHVKRVSIRLGLTVVNNTRQIEKELMNFFPEKLWGDLHHWFIYHGRNICKARTPLCNKCKIINFCDYKKTGGENL